jgi:hypothetical protein
MRIAKSPVELGFHRYDEPRLKKAVKRAADKRPFQRVQAVRLVARGRAINEVAEIAGVRVQTVYNWVNLYLDLIRRPIFKSWLRRETVLQNWPAGAGDEAA